MSQQSDPIVQKLGLRPREWQTLRSALWARQQVPNGHYLCSPGQVSAARRLIARKFLTKVSRKQSGLVTLGSDDAWLVVKYTKANVAAVRKVLASVA